MNEGSQGSSLSCIGAGRLGKTLCRLLMQSGKVSVRQVCNRTRDSAQAAVDFIARGAAVTDSAELLASDYWLLGVPDDHIGNSAARLAGLGILRPGDIVFHCSGSLPSSVLRSSIPQDIRIGSLHPIHSFANPARSVTTFAGTPCAVEGDAEAVEQLCGLCTAIGAKPFRLETAKKPLYHAATVMACNYLVALLETSEQLLLEAGFDEDPRHLLEPLLRQTLDNFMSEGAVQALTGPISRGDAATVRGHLQALRSNSNRQAIYRALGNVAVSIARRQGIAPHEQLIAVERALDE